MFDDSAETLLHPTKVKEGGVEKAKEVVKDLRTRGGTVISSGLLEGAKVAREAQKLRGEEKNSCRMVLLTDMSQYEVISAESVIRDTTIEIAKERIFVSYIGVGGAFFLLISLRVL